MTKEEFTVKLRNKRNCEEIIIVKRRDFCADCQLHAGIEIPVRIKKENLEVLDIDIKYIE